MSGIDNGERAEVIAAHVLYAGYYDDDPRVCGCGLTEPESVMEANDAKIVERWWADHVASELHTARTAHDAVLAQLAEACADAWDEGKNAGAADSAVIIGWGVRGAPSDDQPVLSTNPYREAKSNE